MMKTLASAILTLVLFCVCTHAIADTFGTGANQFEIEFVEIGDPGNTADTTGNPNPAGSVGYVYNMGKYEVSRDMVTKASAEGGLGITLDPMNVVTGGPHPAMPATGVSWNEAARFVNWLNTGQGFQPAYKFSEQPGDGGYIANADIQLWQPGDAGYNAANPFRNRLAHYFLPSVDEWYKAAYYDPNANGGTGGYWNFPTASDTVPTAVSGGTAAGTAVYFQALEQGPADISNAGGLSPYGLMGLGGNVWEWEETEFDLVNDAVSSARGGRGGSVWGSSNSLTASARYGDWPEFVPSVEAGGIGFRVASVPEPSTGLLAALSMLVLLQWRPRQASPLSCVPLGRRGGTGVEFNVCRISGS